MTRKNTEFELRGVNHLALVCSDMKMNHIAFDVPPERIEEYRDRLIAKGVDVGVLLNHDDSEFGVAPENHEGVFVRSIYFKDPDGILVEFAAWTRELNLPSDVRHEPRTAAERTV
jgi:hypothetical protein